jgi:phosphopentomutase
MVTADHGNDPLHTGTDHTREMVPLLVYNSDFSEGRHLDDRRAFADIGITALANFELQKGPELIGEPVSEIFEK